MGTWLGDSIAMKINVLCLTIFLTSLLAGCPSSEGDKQMNAVGVEKKLQHDLPAGTSCNTANKYFVENNYETSGYLPKEAMIYAKSKELASRQPVTSSIVVEVHFDEKCLLKKLTAKEIFTGP
jgi:hypothetical protein